MTISSTGSARLESGGLLFPKSVHKTGTALYVQTLGLFMVMKVVDEPQKKNIFHSCNKAWMMMFVVSWSTLILR